MRRINCAHDGAINSFMVGIIWTPDENTLLVLFSSNASKHKQFKHSVQNFFLAATIRGMQCNVSEAYVRLRHTWYLDLDSFLGFLYERNSGWHHLSENIWFLHADGRRCSKRCSQTKTEEGKVFCVREVDGLLVGHLSIYPLLLSCVSPCPILCCALALLHCGMWTQRKGAGQMPKQTDYNVTPCPIHYTYCSSGVLFSLWCTSSVLRKLFNAFVQIADKVFVQIL